MAWFIERAHWIIGGILFVACTVGYVLDYRRELERGDRERERMRKAKDDG